MKSTRCFSSSRYEQCSKWHHGSPPWCCPPTRERLGLVYDLSPRAGLGFCFGIQTVLMESCLLSCEDVQRSLGCRGSRERWWGEGGINSQQAMIASRWSGGNDSIKLLGRSRVINESTRTQLNTLGLKIGSGQGSSIGRKALSKSWDKPKQAV